MSKIPKNVTIDKDIDEKINNEAKEKDWKFSFMLNEILKRYYKMVEK